MSISRKVRPIRKLEASAATFFASLARRCVAMMPARPRLRPRHMRLVMAPRDERRASSLTSPPAAGAKSWASSTITMAGYQYCRSISNKPLRKAEAARIWRSASRPSRLSTAEMRCWRTRAAIIVRSASVPTASTTAWPYFLGQRDEIPFRVNDDLLNPFCALFENAAQQMGFARTGVCPAPEGGLPAVLPDPFGPAGPVSWSPDQC